MKIKRHLAPVAGALLLVTGAASVALLGGGGSASAAGVPSSAFGLELNLAGNAAIPPTPAVSSADGALVTDSLVDVPAAPLAEAGVIEVSAQNGAAKSTVADLDLVLTQGPLAQLAVIGQQLQPLCDALGQINLNQQLIDQITGPAGNLLPALFDPIIDNLAGTPIDLSLITAIDLSDLIPEDLGDLCDFAVSGNLLGATAVEASCTGKTGTTKIAGTDGLLAALIDTNKPNSRIAIEGLLDVTVNRQTTNADGTFTVDALYVNLLNAVELTVASATCGEVTRDTTVPETPDESDAPAPDPVESHVPVTG